MFYYNYSKALFIGNSGSGKTTLVLKHYLPLAKNFMVVDTNMEISTKINKPKTRNLKDWNFNTPCYYPREYTVKHLEEIIRYARRFNNFLFFIDDLDAFNGGQYYSGNELNTLMVNGRHQNIGVIVTNKRITSIPNLLVQQSQFVHLWAVNAKFYKTLEIWNLSLNYQGNIEDLTRLDTHTFAYFEPEAQNIPEATDPKVFKGFYQS